MFQTEPILWLQAHSSTTLTWILSAVTLLGYAPSYVFAVLTLAFGLRLRPGLSVLVTLLVCGLLTEGLKDGLALPRPSHVDAQVLAIAVVPGVAPRVSVVSIPTRGGAATFWGFPSPEAIAAVRSLPDPGYGFPSGHVGAAMAFVVGTGVFFGLRRVATVGLLWPLVMGLSRMYLGRHFLGDVLGGLAVGCVAVGATGLLLRGTDGSAKRGRSPAQVLPLASVALLVVCLPSLVPLLDPEYAGLLAGVAVAYGVLLTRGLPSDTGTLGQRCSRVAAPAVVLLLAWLAARTLLTAGGWAERRLAVACADAAVILLTLLGGVAIARRFGWYLAASDAPPRSARLPVD